jgi:phage I-like protein
MSNTVTMTAITLARNAEGGAPDRVQLLPPGPEISGRDGRRWTLDDPAELVRAFQAGGTDLPIDWEHASVVAAPLGMPAPAAGWITALEVDPDGSLWGRVEWTEEGGRAVASRAYRYLSPAFAHDKELRIRRIQNAGLTNSPNLRMTALNRTTDQETEMDLTPVTTALGLAAGSDASVIAAAVNRLKTAAEAPDATRFAPREELVTALNRATAAETELAALKSAAAEAEISGCVDAAIAEGRITPAGRDFYLAACRAQGAEAFKAFVAAQPVIAGQQKPATQPGTPGAHGLTAEELAVCRMNGTDPEEFAKAKASFAAADKA